MHTCDFWTNLRDLEVINEFWSFVKAIYSQNPVQYNNVFPIHNLIDLMHQISEISSSEAFCCAYHKQTYHMFYSET